MKQGVTKGTPNAEMRLSLYEGEERLADDRRFELLAELLEAGYPVSRSDDPTRTQGALAVLAPGTATALPAETVQLDVLWEYDRGRHDRAGEGPDAHFIDARDSSHAP